MDITIERLNGTVFKLSEHNISIVDFKIDSPSPRFQWEESEGQDGLIDVGTSFAERILRGSFEFVAEDFLEFPVLRNEIFRMFLSKESFYLIDSREPDRRWLVKASGFSPDQLIANRGAFNIDFIAPSTFAESIMTTLDPNMVSAQITGSGSRVIAYRHNTTTFEILNDGDVMINPRKHPLEITFKGASTNLRIKNLTTGDEWSYTGATAAGDTIKLQGIRSIKNGLSIFRNTNYKLITLQEGWNDFELVGTSGTFEITFDFRFYTL